MNEWFRRVDHAELYLTTVNEAELLYGLQNMPSGRRKDAYATVLELLLLNFSERMLPFDSAAAREYAHIRYNQQRAGKQPKEPDRMIAAIAKSVGADVVTRDVKDFEHSGVQVVNPWEHSP